MPQMPPGVVSSGYYVEPIVPWTQIAGSSIMTSGGYTYANFGQVKRLKNSWVVASAYHDGPSYKKSIWIHDGDPVANPGNWYGMNPGQVEGMFRTSLVHYNPTTNYWFISADGSGEGYHYTIPNELSGTHTFYNANNNYQYIFKSGDNNGSKTILVGYKASNPNDDLGRMIMSTNGTTWTTLKWGGNNDFGNMNEVKYLGNNTWIATSRLYSIYYRSTDNGVTWDRYDLLGITSGTTYHSLVGLGTNGTGTVVMYLLNGSSASSWKIYTSTNYGSTWTNTYTYPVLYSYYNGYTGGSNGGQLTFPHSTIWSPQQSCFAHMSGTKTQLWSSDGITWNTNPNMNQSLMGFAQCASMAIDTTTGRVLAIGSKYNADNVLDTTGLPNKVAYTNDLKGI